MRDVELEEEDVVENGVDVSVADEDEDEEWNRNEVADAGESGRKSSHTHDFLFISFFCFFIKTVLNGKMA